MSLCSLSQIHLSGGYYSYSIALQCYKSLSDYDQSLNIKWEGIWIIVNFLHELAMVNQAVYWFFHMVGLDFVLSEEWNETNQEDDTSCIFACIVQY